jgi:hypothetical protein
MQGLCRAALGLAPRHAGAGDAAGDLCGHEDWLPGRRFAASVPGITCLLVIPGG